MEFEYYPHQKNKQQQKQQQEQERQVDNNTSMAATNINTASTTTGNSSNIVNNNNNTNNNIISSIISNSSSTSSINSTTHTLTATSSAFGSTTADAATVAIAKDMLQLHHGGTLNNNNNNNNNINDGAHSSPTNIVLGTTMTMATTPPISTTTSAPLSNSNNPPAHVAAVNSVITSGGVNTTANIVSSGPPPPPPENALGLLKFNQDVLYITEPITVIGRNSSTSLVHFHVAENNLVSRKHFQVVYDVESRDFLVQCLSKNGIFVDDFLQRRNAEPLSLPGRCFFRFPSTEIRIHFESFLPSAVASQHSGVSSSGGTQITVNHNSNHSASMSGNAHVIIAPQLQDDVHQTQHQHQQQQQQHSHHHHTQQQQHPLPPNLAQQQQQQSMQQQHPHHHQSQTVSQRSSATAAIQSSGATAHILPIDSANAIYSPLKISIPKKEQKSPYLSPTGTISAANSCPASPRQGFPQSQPGYTNYSNNNLQSQDLFQTPSTASYNHNEKPPYSYAQLIVQAISAAPDKQLTLSGIYSFIVKHYPYYRKETNKGWQNSIRHNLSLNRYFIKVARSQDEPGKGSFWRIDPDSGAKLIDHSYKKRRQRSSQGFRPPYGMPRSAPVSPSHMDNSRESSPLQDIVLQSAPGSPGISLENRAAEGDIIYNSQNAHQQTLANNSHQYSSGSPYYVTNQNAGAGQQTHADSSGLSSGSGSGVGIVGGGGGGNNVGALMALKRNHVMAAGAANLAIQQLQQPIQQQQQHHQQQQQQQALHPDIIYDDMPTDYSGHMESGDDDACDAAKRPKYVPEVL